MSTEPPASEPQHQIIVDPSQLGGVYSNFARVTHSLYEFTIDFFRMDGQQGVLVSRVTMSPLMVSELLTALELNWRKYAEKALPPEARLGDDEQGNEGPGDTTPA